MGKAKFCGQKFYGQPDFSDASSFSEAPSGHGHPRLRVMDMRAKSLFSCAPSDGVKVFGPDVRMDIRPDIRGISRPKTLCLGCFSVPQNPPSHFEFFAMGPVQFSSP